MDGENPSVSDFFAENSPAKDPAAASSATVSFAAESGAAKVLTVWITAGGIAVVALSAAIAGLFAVWLLAFTGVFIAAVVFAAQWYPPRYAAALKGRFDGMAVHAVKGVLWKREIFVPAGALRTIEISSTPTQRLFGCRSVILRFAGGSSVLPLLPKQQAEALVGSIESVGDE